LVIKVFYKNSTEDAQLKKKNPEEEAKGPNNYDSSNEENEEDCK
jgi:hypothetical protein